MKVIRLRSVTGPTVHVHCDQILYFQDGVEADTNLSVGEVFLANGDKLVVRELATKIEDLADCH